MVNILSIEDPSGSMKEKIMVVDDEPYITIMIKAIFQKEGYEVVEVNSGGECLEKLKQEKPDIILLDIMMPDMDGYNVCKNIKSNPETADIPVVFISVRNAEIDIVKAIEMGGSDYFVKPFKNQLLVKKVKQILNETKNKQELVDEFRTLEKKLTNLEEKYSSFESELGRFTHNEQNITEINHDIDIDSIKKPALIEHTSRDDYINVISSLSRDLVKSGKKVVMLTSNPNTNKFKNALKTESDENLVKFVEIVTKKPLENGDDPEIQIYLSEIVHYGAIWDVLPKESILIFTQLSEILMNFGMDTTYHFIKNASEKLLDRDVKFIATINKNAHEGHFLAGIESIFSSVYDIRDGKLKNLVLY